MYCCLSIFRTLWPSVKHPVFLRRGMTFHLDPRLHSPSTFALFFSVRSFTSTPKPKDPREVFIDIQDFIKQSTSSTSSDNKDTKSQGSHNGQEGGKGDTIKRKSLSRIFQDYNSLFALLVAFMSVILAFRLLRARHRYEEDVDYMKSAVLLLDEALNGATNATPPLTLSQRLEDIRHTRQQLATLLSSVSDANTNNNQSTGLNPKEIVDKRIKPIPHEILEILRQAEQILGREEQVVAQHVETVQRFATLQRERQHLWIRKSSSSTSQSSTSSLKSSTETVVSAAQGNEDEGRVI